MQTVLAASGFGTAVAFAVLLSAGSVAAKGTYVTFDETHASAVNATNTVTGATRSGDGFSGLIRTVDGTVTPFAVPGAKQTLPASINDAGAVAGAYDSGDFIRSPDGSITTFAIPASAEVVSINNTGDITGWYNDGVVVHAFVRAADGTITTFDGPGAPVETIPAGMNDKGVITGFYTGEHERGFIRAADGTITTFDAPGASYGTVPAAINFDGSIAGIYRDDKQIEHGFVRQADGAFTKFDIQDCPQLYLITGRNSKGVISGYCVRKPRRVFGFN